MEAFRLVHEPFASYLCGKGASRHGARWNSIDVEMIYAAPTRALAMAEIAVHFTLVTLPPDYRLVTIYVPDDISLAKLRIEDLPEDWLAFPHAHSTQ